MSACRSVLDPLVLSDAAEQLERWADVRKFAALAFRCRIVLACAERENNTEVPPDSALLAAREQVAVSLRRPAPRGAARRASPRAPRSIGDDDVEMLIVKTLEETPSMPRTGRRVRWPTRRDESVSCVAHLAGLLAQTSPGRYIQTLARPTLCRQGARHCHLYINPPHHTLLCVDEKTQSTLTNLPCSPPLAPALEPQGLVAFTGPQKRRRIPPRRAAGSLRS